MLRSRRRLQQMCLYSSLQCVPAHVRVTATFREHQTFAAEATAPISTTANSLSPCNTLPSARRYFTSQSHHASPGARS